MDSFSFYQYLQSKGFERRESQEEMIHLVEEVIREGGVRLIEAPTGTGKTFAYLIPIITSRQRAIISTGTKVLQDQLKRDIEFLTSHYKLLTGEEVSYAVLKGKGNYLCIDRFKKENLSSQEKADIPELMETEWEGDLTLSSVSPEVAGRINVDEDYCTNAYRKVCPHRGECYYWEKVKSRERSAQILVINHALLALKEFEETEDKVLVIDEAHELDRYLTLASTAGISLYFIRELTSSLQKLTGREINLPVEEFFRDNFARLFKEETEEVSLDSLAPYMEDFKTRICQPLYDLFDEAVGQLKEELREFLEGRLMVSFKFKGYLEKTLLLPREIIELTGASYEDPDHDEEALIEKLKRVEFLSGKLRKLKRFVRLCEEEDPSFGYKLSKKWSRKLQTFNYRMEVFPVFPRGVVEPEAYKGVVLTSATIDPEDISFTTGIEGDFYRLSKNFDYSSITFLIHDTNPKKPQWEEKLVEAFEDIRSLYDKVLVLLTNKAHLKLFEGNGQVAKQGEDSLNSLISALREGKIKVLVGLDSLWTGIDVRGEKGILMSKLPFDSPEDPVTYHRIKYLRSLGEDPFHYQRRKAFIKFRQGVGRLKRQKEDTGTIVLCDNRIWRYREFINYLKELGIKVVYLKNLTARRTWERPY